MQYMGGKWKLREKIANVLNQFDNREYLEPFVGGASVVSVVNFSHRTASDIHLPLINMYRALQAGWQPPDNVTEDEYLLLKKMHDPNDPMTAFAGFGCSFGAGYFAGFARSRPGRNFARAARNSLLAIRGFLADVNFTNCDFRTHKPSGATVYCDPPYLATRKYSVQRNFDHAAFWKTMRQWSADNDVIISEYEAPDDFECIAEFPTILGMRTKANCNTRIERLFKFRG